MSEKELIGTRIKAIPREQENIGIDLDNSVVENILDEYAHSTLDLSTFEKFISVGQSRESVYRLIDTMEQDTKVATIIESYAENATEANNEGHVMWVESEDENCRKWVESLLDEINIDKHAFGWMYSLLKYGDLYLQLIRQSDFEKAFVFSDTQEVGDRQLLKEELFKQRNNEKLEENVILNIPRKNDRFAKYLHKIDNPGEMYDLAKYSKSVMFIKAPYPIVQDVTKNTNSGIVTEPNWYQYKMNDDDVEIYVPTEFVHLYVDDNSSRTPEEVEIFKNEDNTKSISYQVIRGKSIIYDWFKAWRMLSLMEDSIILNRLTKSSIIRIFQIDVGDMSKAMIKAHIQGVKAMVEQKSAINTDNYMSDYANPGPIENSIYVPVHEGKGTITVGSVGGDFDPKSLVDLEYFLTNFYAGTGIPKQFSGWCLRGDTLIPLLNGEKITIKELFENKDKYIGKGILGVNKDGSLCPTKIKDIEKTKDEATFIRLWLDNDNYVDVTPEHRMMLRDGTFVEAKDIKVNDSLMPYYSKTVDNRTYVLDNLSGKYLPQYRVVAQKKFDCIPKGNQIHHSDCNKLNDDFDNLENLTVEEHYRKHEKRLRQIVENYLQDYNVECNHKVVKIEYLDVVEPSYDLNVEDDCHTFALECGIFVHNCEDAAGFSGGESLALLSSQFGKRVKRYQQAFISGITTFVNIIALDKNLEAYVNNFTLRMTQPITREDIERREAQTNALGVLRDTMDVLSDVSDTVIRLKIVKTLMQDITSNSEVTQYIQEQIDLLEEEKEKNPEESSEETAQEEPIARRLEPAGSQLPREREFTNPMENPENLETTETATEIETTTTEEPENESNYLPSFEEIGVNGI